MQDEGSGEWKKKHVDSMILQVIPFRYPGHEHDEIPLRWIQPRSWIMRWYVYTFETSLVNERWFADIGTYRIQSVSIIGSFGVFSGSKDLHKASTAPWRSGSLHPSFSMMNHSKNMSLFFVCVCVCVSCVSFVKRHTLGSSTLLSKNSFFKVAFPFWNCKVLL